MAIDTNEEVVVAYDLNQPIWSSKLDFDDDNELEHAGQCVCVEMLRGLMAAGLTVEEYNNMSNEDWESYKEQARFRASLNVVAPVAQLNATQVETGANLGGNYFEHGYAFIMNGVQQADKVQFTKFGGV